MFLTKTKIYYYFFNIMNNKNSTIVIVGPSGVGKGTSK